MQAAVDERPRLQRRCLHRLCPMPPQRRRPRRLCPMRTSPIAIGWCRRRHGTHARDDDREQGQGEALVRAGEVPRRANRKDERCEPEQGGERVTSPRRCDPFPAQTWASVGAGTQFSSVQFSSVQFSSQTGHTGAHGYTDHTDEPHNHPHPNLIHTHNTQPARQRDDRNRGRLN